MNTNLLITGSYPPDICGVGDIMFLITPIIVSGNYIIQSHGILAHLFQK